MIFPSGSASIGPDPRGVSIVVLAGGTSSRFGPDKLAARYGADDLLTAVVASLPIDWDVVMVGPPRAVGRTVTWVREDPAGSGPAAALVTGIRATLTATATSATTVLTVPGDSPQAGRGSARLLAALASPTGHDRVVAADDRPNPLWLGLRGPGLDRVRAADPADWIGRPARALMLWIDPVVVPLSPAWMADVDVPADLPDALR